MPRKNWFKRYDNSDSETESDSDSDTNSSMCSNLSNNSTPVGLSQWLKGGSFNASLNANMDNILLSNEVKKRNIIKNMEQRISENLDISNWIEIYKILFQIKQDIKIGDNICVEYIHIINLLDKIIKYENSISIKESLKVINQLKGEYGYTINLYNKNMIKNIECGLSWTGICGYCLQIKKDANDGDKLSVENIRVINLIDRITDHENTFVCRESIKIVNHLKEKYTCNVDVQDNVDTIVLSEEEVLQNRIDQVIVSMVTLTEMESLLEDTHQYVELHIRVLSMYISKHLGTRHLTFLECKVVYKCLRDTLNLLKANPQFNIKEPSTEQIPKSANIFLHITLSNAVTSLNKHYKYLLQNAEIKSSEYLLLQNWESELIKLCELIHTFYHSQKSPDKRTKISTVLLCILDLSYHHQPYNPCMLKYMRMIQKNAGANIISHSILYLGLHLIINNKYEDAVALIKTTQHTTEDELYIYTPELCILYNQFLARVGIVAFEQKYIEDSFMALSELCQNPNLDILLGQVSLERDSHLLIPHHKHVDTDTMIERFLLCCLLVDLNPQPYPFSKLYSAILYKYNKEGIMGEPVSLDEIIYMASKMIKTGKWKKGYKLLEKIPSFTCIGARVVNLLKIKSLEGYVRNFGKYFENFYIPDLAEEYQLPDQVISTILHRV